LTIIEKKQMNHYAEIDYKDFLNEVVAQ